MEKARSYWTTIGRRRFSEMPFLGAQIPSLAAARTSSFDESWEEEAFAKDSAGHLGGCVWPPRSYSCSFCRREFRSAQALGGHMNVHRKDRAMLRQCSSPRAAAGDQTLDITRMGSPAREVQHSDSTTANPNPNSASSLSPRVSAAVPAQEWSLQSPTSCLYSSSIVRIVREKLKEYSIISAAAAPTTLQLFAVPESSPSKTDRSLQRIGGDDLGTREAKSRTVGDEEGGADENNECRYKRRRIESEERRSVQQDAREEALEEELDLELRLGDISQVK